MHKLAKYTAKILLVGSVQIGHLGPKQVSTVLHAVVTASDAVYGQKVEISTLADSVVRFPGHLLSLIRHGGLCKKNFVRAMESLGLRSGQGCDARALRLNDDWATTRQSKETLE
ncbi:hypothetical protein IAR50_000993 [Cryptococcus sp. DSM 104548]